MSSPTRDIRHGQCKPLQRHSARPMSDDTPEITVTRGKRHKRSERSRTSSSATRSPSSGLGLPGLGTVVSGAIRSAHNVWRAGLGVVAVVHDAGTQVFDSLVEEGKSWGQARRERTAARAQQVQHLSDEEKTVRAVEDRVREEVNDALQRVGVPHRDDVDDLRAQIDALSERVAQLRQTVEDDGF